MIKAIETIYKGYRFRSRLEARWAVFFDALGIQWEYEPEGFDVDGERYLPDFFIKLEDEWFIVEIKHKGYKPSLKDNVWKSIDDNSLKIGRGFHSMWIFCGVPEFENSVQGGFSDNHNLTCLLFGESKRVSDACTKARQARFEHGENP
jgi:hypothetical protein